MAELGDQLRQAREARGLTFEQVEEITRIRRRYLQALEEEDYGQLPGEVFVRGFLRNYALALGLDPEAVLAASGRVASSPIPSPHESQPEEILDEPLMPTRGGHWVISVAIGIMVVVAIGLASWTLYRFFGPGRPQPQPTATPQPSATAAPAMLTVAPAPTASATPTAEPSATPEPVTGILLRLEATARAWVRVTLDGRLAYEGDLEPGQIQQWQGIDQILLRTGNAGGLRVWYNGQEEPPLGGPGEVVDHTWNAGILPEGAGTAAPAGESTPGPVGAPPSTATSTPTVPTATPTAAQ